jgi:hypothetical protein
MLDVEQQINNCKAHFLPEEPSRRRILNWLKIAVERNKPFKANIQEHKPARDPGAPQWIKEAVKEGWKT